MGYRGEDVSATHGDRGRQTPWQPSSGAPPESTGAWDGRSRGYPDDENYPTADGGYGFQPEGGYPGQGQQGYPAQDDQYGGAYGQQPYGQQQPYSQQPYGPHDGYGPGQGQYDGYGPGQGMASAGGYGGPQGYPQGDDYVYGHGQDSPSGYGQTGYDQPTAPGYAPGGHQDPSGGYGQPPGYQAQPAGGGFPAPRGGSGDYPALPPGGQGGYPGEDAGNDWYGGQPAAANGASFADTGTYRLNGSVLDEYGTGPREAMRDQGRGYAPDQGRQGTGPLPGAVNPAASGPQAYQRTGPQSVRETRAQERYDDRAGYPDADQTVRRPSDASGGYPTADNFAAQGYGRYGQAPAPASDPAGDAYDDYGDRFNDLAAANDDPYQDLYGDGDDAAAGGGGRRGGKAPGREARGPLGGKRLLFAALGVVAVGIIGVAAYAFLFRPSSDTDASAQGPLPTGTTQPSQEACAKTLGTYCHIQAATDDPKPLTVAELYPPAFTNEQDKSSYTLVSTKLDTKCSTAVIGSTLISALQAGKCTQVVRASYVSSDNKIMGTIGVINLSTTNEAHYAGRDVGQNDFIAPLTSKTGVASKLGNGTGVVEAEYKGHYLILTWSEFVNGTDPTTKAEQAQLQQFSNDLVEETANPDLSQRMITGAPATPAPSS